MARSAAIIMETPGKTGLIGVWRPAAPVPVPELPALALTAVGALAVVGVFAWRRGSL